jgi:hypothetical protein
MEFNAIDSSASRNAAEDCRAVDANIKTRNNNFPKRSGGGFAKKFAAGKTEEVTIANFPPTR